MLIFTSMPTLAFAADQTEPADVPAVAAEEKAAEKEEAPATVEVTADSATLPSDVPAREGYVFSGWAESADAATAAYQPGDTFSMSDHTTLYAVWELEEEEEEAIDEPEDEPEDESEPPAKKSNNTVETGDNTNVVAPIAIMCIALAGIIALLIVRKRRQK